MPRDQYRRLRLTLPERPTPTIKRLLVTMLGCVTMPSWPIRPPTLQEWPQRAPEALIGQSRVNGGGSSHARERQSK